MSQLQTQRTITRPTTLLRMAELRGRLTQFGEVSDEHRRIAQDLLFGLENGYKSPPYFRCRCYWGAAGCPASALVWRS